MTTRSLKVALPGSRRVDSKFAFEFELWSDFVGGTEPFRRLERRRGWSEDERQKILENAGCASREGPCRGAVRRVRTDLRLAAKAVRIPRHFANGS